MSGRLFVPQPQLDRWLEEGQVDVTAEGLHLPDRPRPLSLEPAFRFLSLLEGEDGASLLSRVKTEAQLRAMGAEPCGDSVLIGEVAYEVEPGFLAVVPPPGNSANKAPVRPVGSVQDRVASRPAGDKEGAELLSEFLLEKLR